MSISLTLHLLQLLTIILLAFEVQWLQTQGQQLRSLVDRSINILKDVVDKTAEHHTSIQQIDQKIKNFDTDIEANEELPGSS